MSSILANTAVSNMCSCEYVTAAMVYAYGHGYTLFNPLTYLLIIALAFAMYHHYTSKKAWAMEEKRMSDRITALSQATYYKPTGTGNDTSTKTSVSSFLNL